MWGLVACICSIEKSPGFLLVADVQALETDMSMRSATKPCPISQKMAFSTGTMSLLASLRKDLPEYLISQKILLLPLMKICFLL